MTGKIQTQLSNIQAPPSAIPLLVNGHTSERQQLPQGSPLSPILSLFFNADPVQHALNTNGGSMVFVDDYSAWVT